MDNFLCPKKRIAYFFYLFPPDTLNTRTDTYRNNKGAMIVPNKVKISG